MFRTDAPDARWAAQVRASFWSRKMTVDASDDVVTVTVGSRSAAIRWRDCHGFAESGRAYLVRQGERGFFVVPRRAFRTEKKDAAFRELASRALEPATTESDSK